VVVCFIGGNVDHPCKSFLLKIVKLYTYVVLALTWQELESTIYHTWGKHANKNTSDAIGIIM